MIGNSAYRHVAKLANPGNDAAAIGLLFRRAGFEVVEMRGDPGVSDMRRAVRDFSDKARDADMAVVYHASHGIEIGGNNYLVPVDAVRSEVPANYHGT